MRGKLHHIEIYVKDLEVTKEFWGWLLRELGYEVFQSWNQGISYKLDESYIVFVQAEEAYLDVPYHRCRAGLNHLAFHGGSRTEVDVIRKQLRTKGAQMLYDDKYPYASGPDYYAVYCEDPDRMKVEIVAD